MRGELWLLLLAHEEDDLLRSLLFGKQKELEEGRTYLTKEKKPERALAHFRRAIESGFRPLYVTRQHPNHIARSHAGKVMAPSRGLPGGASAGERGNSHG